MSLQSERSHLERTIVLFCQNHLEQVEGRHKHFSFVCRRSSIVAYGYAKKHKTNPKMGLYAYKAHSGIHSEFDVFRKLGFAVAGLTLVNVRMNRQGRLMRSKPCPCCTRMLLHVGIKSVYYSDFDQQFHRLPLKSLR